jgi:hypothetical protein
MRPPMAPPSGGPRVVLGPAVTRPSPPPPAPVTHTMPLPQPPQQAQGQQDFYPVDRTAEMPNVAQGAGFAQAPPPPAAPAIRSAPPPPPAVAQLPAVQIAASAQPPVIMHAPASVPPPPASTAGVPSRERTTLAPPPEGTPPIVIRFLLLCGLLTVLGLIALIYLEM